MALKISIVSVTPFQQNCALLWDSGTGVGAVVDPGGDVEKILAAIETAGAKVAAIYLTHGHLDHAGGATQLATALGVPIIGPDIRDKPLLDALAEQGLRFGIQDMQAVTPERWLAEGERIDIAGTSFEVLHCPGHTPGHVVLVNREGNFGIFGDVLFRNSIGRTDFEYGDHDALIAAIKTKLLPLPDDFMFICGHGVHSTIGEERKSNPFLR
jgi:glyoxylase-like metal-dependent hydrolase (beta-lactamase superfamily II)